jgi:hypothetical protein
VRTGSECNPGACYNYLGIAEAEVELLVGKKEGCTDDLEFIQVPRPASCAAPAVEAPPQAPAAGAPAMVDSARHLAVLDASSVELGHPAEVAMKWVQVGAARCVGSMPLVSCPGGAPCLGLWSTTDGRSVPSVCSACRLLAAPAPVLAAPAPALEKHPQPPSAQVPLGSVRASLGYMSTFEDAYALVQFVEGRYKDRQQ